jgi:hypothetical protein
LGQCHYQLEGSGGAGLYVAGQFTSGQLQFSGEALVDAAISNLSLCAGVVYDTCGASVLGQALNYIAAIDAASGGKLVLSIALEAGQYAPQSLLNASADQYVGYVDLPKFDPGQGQTFCTRQPLAWRSPYVLDYTVTMSALLNYIGGLTLKLPPVQILKYAAITANSSEFNVPAKVGVQPTATDPALPGAGPQGDPAIQCPDQTAAQTGVNALLGAYNASGTSQSGTNMADSYEAAFGYGIGYEAGLGARSKVAGAIISLPIKGQDGFAHVDCGLTGTAACIPDPSPTLTFEYNWSAYYMTRFINDLYIKSSIAEEYAAMGFAAACLGGTCTPSSYALTPWQLSVVYTGLDPTVTGSSYTWSPSCWLNNTSSNNLSASTLKLYTSPTAFSTVAVIGPTPLPPAPAGGTMLGWQTAPNEATACQTGGYSLQDGLNNGGQFIEIETDAASEPTCAVPLQRALTTLMAPTNNYSCLY